MTFKEANYEKAIINCFEQTLGYNYIYGPDVLRDYTQPLYIEELKTALTRINPNISPSAVNEAFFRLTNIESGSLLQRNMQFMKYLQNGISVDYYDGKEETSTLVNIIDYKTPSYNSFIVSNQWTIVDNSEKRTDIIIFLNGIPIVVFELKSPSSEESDISNAYLQLRNYMKEIPSLFMYNAFCVISDLSSTRAGTITSGEDWYMEWKTKDGSYENTQYAQFDTFIEGIFDKHRLLDILKNFICFSADKKILAAYHQYFAVNKAVESTIRAADSNGKGGVFWHTQGSGKSASMVFYTHLLQEAMQSPIVVVITDRNDLDDQLLGEFAKCSGFLRQEPQQAISRSHLREILEGREANGIIFTTAQKFEESTEPLSDRSNIIVIADEAHRSQFIDESVDSKTGKRKKTFGLIIRESLPNATYIGFTGTPISTKDRSTVEVFGEYIDIYDMTQSVEDGATRPVYYESRVIHLKLDEEILRRIDAEYDLIALEAEGEAISKSKKQLSRIDSILGADQTITALCEDIVEHYEQNRQYEQTGKAMIVAYSRPIAMDIYNKLIALRPNWKDKLCLVMTSDNNDPEEWSGIIGNKRRRDEMARRFKDDNDPIKIAIVVDMWLTGFNLPSLSTMYVYKPMSGHNLMQAIARVNRVYKDKEGGLVVDYVGIASALKQAMNDYTQRDKKNYGDTDVAKTAYPKFIEKLEVCRNLAHGYDYSKFMRSDASDLDRAKIISGGINFFLSPQTNQANNIINVDFNTVQFAAEQSMEYGTEQNKKDIFIKEATLLRQALSLCSSLVTGKQRYEAAFFEAVRIPLIRLSLPDKTLPLKEINARINELLKASIQSEGVINLFSDIDTGFSLFDSKFLEQIANMTERNLSVEILRKLLAEQVSHYRRTNIVKSEKFSEMLNEAMKSYLNGMLSNEEVIAELIKMAKEIAASQIEGNALGLNEEEIAFYDALTLPESIKDFYTNEQLVAMTQELTDRLRKSRTIDWQKKESARAGMRRMVRKLLKKHKYPPEGLDFAVKTVIEQCEMWADN